jgi:hypothetical protein
MCQKRRGVFFKALRRFAGCFAGLSGPSRRWAACPIGHLTDIAAKIMKKLWDNPAIMLYNKK